MCTKNAAQTTMDTKARNPGRDQKTGAVLWGVDRGVRGLYFAANRAVRGISVKVAFSCKMEHKGTKADQNQTRNRKQQEEAEKRQ